MNNAKIYINESQLNTTEAQYIGEAVLTFNFTVTGACVQSTDITIFLDDTPFTCTNSDTCSETILHSGNVHVNVSVMSYEPDIRFPQNDDHYRVGSK